jgi:IMP dehydrogenase/GMP reductase
MTEELILSGVDIVKVGIGPGSVCTLGLSWCGLSTIISDY